MTSSKRETGKKSSTIVIDRSRSAQRRPTLTALARVVEGGWGRGERSDFSDRTANAVFGNTSFAE